MEVVSTMGTGSLGRELNLENLIEELEKYLGSSVQPNFTNNGMVTIRLELNGPAYTIYRTGSFQIRGAKTEEDLVQAANRFRNTLLEIGVDINNYEFKHNTSVFVDDFDRHVNLEALTIALGLEVTEFEPEQFTGLIYRPLNFDVTLVVFASGKIIVGGTVDRHEAQSAILNLKEEISTID